MRADLRELAALDDEERALVEAEVGRENPFSKCDAFTRANIKLVQMLVKPDRPHAPESPDLRDVKNPALRKAKETEYAAACEEHKIALRAYDALLDECPLCYGYWKRLAEFEVAQGSVERANQVFERALVLGLLHRREVLVQEGLRPDAIIAAATETPVLSDTLARFSALVAGG